MLEKVEALFTLLAYCLRRFPLFYGCLLASLSTVLLELAAMASLFPLAEYAAGREVSFGSRWIALLDVFGARPGIKTFILLFLVLLIARTMSQLLATVLASLFFRKLIAHLSSTAFSVFVTRLSFSDIQKNSIGYYLNLAGEEANRASQIVHGIVRLVPAAFLSILYFAFIAFQSSQVAGFVVLFLVAVLILLRGSFRRSHELGGRQQVQSRALNSHFIESLSALRSVKAFTAEHFVAERYRTMILAYAKTCFKVDLINALARSAPALVLMILVGSWALFILSDNSLTAHLPLILILTALLMRFFPVTGQALDTFLRMVADLRSGKEVVDVVRRIDDVRALSAERGTKACPRIESIDLREVSFSYPNGVRPVANMTTRFCRGHSYALVGPSGAGKSTLFDLLLKYIDPDDGEILINDQDIASISETSLRRRIALVEQQIRIFNDTMLHNITLGMVIPQDRVAEACSIAGLDSLLSSLPKGLNTLLEYQGANLSGGQRQRIGLARALARQPDVLLLDESTNALDRDTRDEVVANILAAYKDRIVVFATHDDYVFSKVDMIMPFASTGVAAEAPTAIGQQY